MQRDAAYSNLTLDAALRRNELPARDAALVSALVYGVEERLYTIDYQLSLYLKQPLKKLKPEVLAALRLGVCQLLFMERIPSSAAVCESVSLVKQNGCAFAAGLVNAVLRKVSDAGICLPEQEADALQMLSIRYSFPGYFLPALLQGLGLPSRGKRFSIFVLRRAAKALPLLSACVGKDRCVPLTCIPPARH